MHRLTKLVKECSFSRYCLHEKLILEDWKEISNSLGNHLHDLIQFVSRDTEVCVNNFVVCQYDSRNSLFCDECHEKVNEKKEEVTSSRLLKRKEKANLGELMKPKYHLQIVRFLVQQMKKWQDQSSDGIVDEESKYLISSSWFQSWLDYLNNNGKRPEISPLEGLLCEHGFLVFDISTADDLFDRRALCVSATCWEEIVKAYEDVCLDRNGIKIEMREKDGKGIFSLPSCHSCMEKRKNPENNGEIELVLMKVQELDEIKDKGDLSLDSLELYSTCIKSEMMTTRRSRVLRVHCNPNNSVSELKLIIFQYLDIAPVAQQLYLGKQTCLVHGSSLLRDYHISNGSLLFLYIDKSKADVGAEDFALPEESKVELGFVGSQLFGL